MLAKVWLLHVEKDQSLIIARGERPKSDYCTWRKTKVWLLHVEKDQSLITARGERPKSDYCMWRKTKVWLLHVEKDQSLITAHWERRNPIIAPFIIWPTLYAHFMNRNSILEVVNVTRRLDCWQDRHVHYVVMAFGLKIRTQSMLVVLEFDMNLRQERIGQDEDYIFTKIQWAYLFV